MSVERDDSAVDKAALDKAALDKDNSAVDKGQPESRDLSFVETAQSVLFAMLGVQKSKNAERDFRKGKASHFIVLGVAFGILFVCAVAGAVSLVLSKLT